jgi:SAM-dependent methyltransferase
MEETHYDSDFYDGQQAGSYSSACEIIPILINLIKPKSVLDIGCGIGTWLSAFKENNVTDVYGIDGDYVDKAMLKIEPEHFMAYDLNQKVKLERTFDLAISLEVGEHISKENCPNLVASLVVHAPAILFSAAIPLQKGTNHINEQWPEFWANLFRNHDYEVIDCVRDDVWDNPRVEYFYAQNALLYVHKDKVSDYDALQPYLNITKNRALARIHPLKWLESQDPKGSGLRKIAKELPYAVSNSITQITRSLKK